MKNIIHKPVVLVLNKNWQAIAITTPAQAFSQMASGVATGLDIKSDEWMEPVHWKEWSALKVRSSDLSIGVPSGKLRVPMVIALCKYSLVPIYRPKLSSKNIWLRDGSICQYSGRVLKADEGNIDHVLPVSRGGSNSWENCVLSCKKINEKKADRTPIEAGLQLIRKPRKPKTVPMTMMLKNVYEFEEWNYFLSA